MKCHSISVRFSVRKMDQKLAEKRKSQCVGQWEVAAGGADVVGEHTPCTLR
eukprot:NODE_7666_length_311_cov_129.603053_g6928_i0.p1 GENE.NODE_7666_length_311_cov_129.603053_g6928_i0~~NODE_7666_length_311_cov_129.603053_g6928_i0.p1  ORF type:complete len:51 (-),score=9.26 NODE_7666_length_311_cov_129.603053_g6928_i0:4-156(-)